MTTRYQIKEKIGQGGLGDVFIAHDTQLGREVAMKRMRPVEGTTPDDLLKEAKVLSSLQHPNILTVYDVGKDDEGAYVVMELLRGETLEQVVERGALPYEDFKQVATQSLEGLIAAQAVGLVHRDMKPGNLMIIWHASGKFQLKILDFGLAKFSRAPSKQTEDQEEGIMGSIFFMAPEQFEREPLDGRTDLYALGCIFYYALTTKYPFSGETAPLVMASHLQHLVKPLGEFRPDLPPWMVNWVMWLMNRRPDERPLNAKQALDFFQQQDAAGAAGPPMAFPGYGMPPMPYAMPGYPPVYPPQPGYAPPLQPAYAPVPPPPAYAPPPVAPSHSGLRQPAQGGRRPLNPPPPPGQGAPVPPPPSVRLKYDPSATPVAKPGFPKWAMFTLPALVIALIVVLIIKMSDRKQVEGDQQRFDEMAALAQEDKLTGGPDDVEFLARFLRMGGKFSQSAAFCLQRMKGDGIDAALLEKFDSITDPTGLANTISVLDSRQVKDASGKLLDTARKDDETVRLLSFKALSTLGKGDDLEPMVALLPLMKTDPQRAAARNSIVAVADREAGSRRTRDLLSAFGNSTPEVQAEIITILGQVGGSESFKLISDQLTNTEARTAMRAVGALGQWPTLEPLDTLTQIARTDPDATMKKLALGDGNSGILRLLGLPGNLPGAERITRLRQLLPLCIEPSQKSALIYTLTTVADPASLAFARELKNDAALAREAAQAESRIDASLKLLVSVKSPSALLTADHATLTGTGARIDKAKNVITDWVNPNTWLQWDINVEEAGKYTVEVLQSSQATEENLYRVSLYGQNSRVSVRKTANADTFAAVPVCTVLFIKPGTYRVMVQPLAMKSIPLMTLKAVQLTKQ